MWWCEIGFLFLVNLSWNSPAMPGELGNWALKAAIVSYHPAQQKCTYTQAASYIGIRLRTSVYRKCALRQKILILYSQKCHRTKFLSSRKWTNQPLFWPCEGDNASYLKTVLCQATLDDPYIGLTPWPLLRVIRGHMRSNAFFAYNFW